MRFIVSFVLAATSVVCAAEQTEYEPGYEPDVVFLLCDRSGQEQFITKVKQRGHWVVLFDRANLWLGDYHVYVKNFATDNVREHVLSDLRGDLSKGVVSKDPNGESLSRLEWDSECEEAPDNINFVGCGPFSKPEPISSVSGFVERLARERPSMYEVFGPYLAGLNRETLKYTHMGTDYPCVVSSVDGVAEQFRSDWLTIEESRSSIKSKRKI